MTTPYSAANSLSGYLYQVRYALLLLLKKMEHEPDAVISLETRDDKRAARMQSGPLVSVWKRQVVDGRVRYVLNDEHPLLAELLGDKDGARAARARACLRLVSNAFPADLYFSDAAR